MKTMIPFRLSLAALMLLSTAAGAATQHYQATLESSRWQVEAAHDHCALVHEIPRFGRARFEQRSGRRLQFILQADLAPVDGREARIVSVPPQWKYGSSERELGQVRLVQGKTPLRMPRQQALRLYYELEQGMAPAFLYQDWADDRDRMEVRLSPVRFREALPDFVACTRKLVYLDFEPVGEKTVYFTTDSARLSRATRRVLEKLARDYRSGSRLRIVLGGHADARGDEDYNLALSKRRATRVARYLVSRGVPRKAIESRFFGETFPADPDDDPEAWARNRRVTVWLAEK